jgi:predicted TIM-barrel fold metal-dependent hydrolase
MTAERRPANLPTSRGGTVDYLCNSFLPERADDWDRIVEAQGIPLKVRRDPTDGFAPPDEVVRRMDELGIATVAVVTGDAHATRHMPHYGEVIARWDETESLASRYPGRFVALWAVDLDRGMAGVRRAAEALDQRWVAGLWNHVHSFDRRFDDADLYPFYALAADREVPVVMQSGTSGGLAPSECGRPIGIDRPALYFPETSFVLSHTGWPWVTEAIAMALKHPNVYLGTAAYPPRHWPDELVAFVRRPGRRKVLFGTNFPTVGHRHALGQLPELALGDEVEHLLLEGNARSIFGRLPGPPESARRDGAAF